MPSSFHSNWEQRIGLILIAVILFFSPLLEGGTTHLAAMILRLLILSVFCVCLTKMVASRIVLLPRSAVTLPVLSFLVLATVSTIASPYTNQSMQWLMIIMSYAGFLYCIAVFVEQWEDLIKFRSLVWCIAVGEALWAFVQHAQGQVERPSGTFFNPNYLAGYLATGIILLLACICHSKAGIWLRHSRMSWKALSVKLIQYGVLAVLLVALLQTGSRGGAISLVIGAAVVIGLRFGPRGLLPLGLLLALVVAIPNPIRDRAVFEHTSNPAAYARWQMWQSAVREIGEHPFGIGIGLFQYTSPQYSFPVEEEIVRYGKVAQRPHNEYLQIGVELGLLGLGVFIWGLVLFVSEVRSVLRQRLARRQRAFVVGLSGAILAILAQAAVDANLHEPALAILLTLFVGSVIAARRLCIKNIALLKVRVIHHPLRWAILGCLAISLVAVHSIRLGLAYQNYESGNRLVNQREIEQAIESFHKAIALDPGKSLYHNSLAAAYFKLHRHSHDQALADAAIAEMRTAIHLNPIDGRLQGIMGFVSASQVSSLRPREMTRDDRMWLQQAVEAYQRAAILEPFSYSHRLEVGRLMLQLGERSKAETNFQKVIELEPNYLPARDALARLYAESGKNEMAEMQFKEIVARKSQFSPRVTNPLERAFLQVDVAGLERLLAGKTSAT